MGYFNYYALLSATLVAYFLSSKLIFNEVYDTIKVVVDELYHIPQGLSYCNRNYTYWNEKITTLPGLYLISSAVISPLFSCNTYNLRFVNLAASCVNLALFSSLLKFVYGSTMESHLKIVLQALNLAILPPLYFFSHVYYTDTLSLTFLLMFTRLCFSNGPKLLVLLFGFGSMLMRQTNVAWIAMVFGHKVLDIFIRSSRVFGNRYISGVTLSKKSRIAKDVDKSKLKRYYGIVDVVLAVKFHTKNYFLTFFEFITLQDFLMLITHGILLSCFILFVFLNGGIVVGDKDAHEAVIHIPQMLYFLLFYGVFGLPYVLAKFVSTLRLFFSNKAKVFLLCALLAIVIHFNTIVHPYLLADNRHYTFYIWNRFFGKYYHFKYAMIPLYVFLLFSLYDNLKDQNCISFLLPYTVSTFLVLALQKMIEIRYFLIPYIILRLRFVRPNWKIVLLEFVWYLALNAVTFQVFFTKQVYWEDFDYAQRIIW